jgi:hypothetical protein
VVDRIAGEVSGMTNRAAGAGSVKKDPSPPAPPPPDEEEDEFDGVKPKGRIAVDDKKSGS